MYKKEPLPQEKRAVTPAQFDKSYRDLMEKMHRTESVG